MLRIWQTLAARINGRSLRDRILILIAGLAVVGAVSYMALLAGTLDRKEKLRRSIVAKENEVAQIRAQIESAKKGQEDPDAASKQRIAQLHRLMEETNAGVAKKRDRLVAPERIPQLLEDMIARQKELQLVSLVTIPVQSLIERKSADDDDGSRKVAKPDTRTPEAKAAESKPARRDDGPRGIFRHGVKITLRGDYLELRGYLAALEKLPVQLFWKDLEVKVVDAASTGKDGTPNPAGTAEMTVTLFTVSFDKIWLQV